MENKRKDTKSGKRKILLVDDYLGLRRALAQLINRESDLEVCAVAGNIGQALSTIADRPFDLEPIQITRSITAGCKARCLRCRPKMFSTWRKPRLRAFLSCRLGLELFARPHNDPVIRISS